ncbi:MAG: TetR/AcrR family transcriptional regulator [Solirubrobacterales bacterium]
MSPRASATAAAATRAGIVDAAVHKASNEGLEAVTIGQLAQELNMSKAGVIGPFGTKEDLQLATLEQAIEVFRIAVWEPVAEVEPGLPRLEAIIESWLAYLTGNVLPGGCFLTQSATEFDGRPGLVKAEVARTLHLWERILENEARVAIANGDLPAGTDPRQVAFEFGAMAQGVNQAFQLHGEADAADRGRRGMRRVLGPA